jgi:hypothetical protein
MNTKALPEVWLRGPIPGIPALLQPVAHALLQAREEVNVLMDGFPEAHLWDRPAGVAAPGFHLQHLAGVLDRLFTYAAGKALSGEQLAELAAEGRPGPEETAARGIAGPEETAAGEMAGPGKLTVGDLIGRWNRQVDKAIEQLKNTPEQVLTDVRGVGRALLPSTVLGLLVHAAEHTQRHVGQLLVTVRVVISP